MITLEITPIVTTIEEVSGITTVELNPKTTVVEVNTAIPTQSLFMEDDLATNQTVNGVEVNLIAAEDLSFGDVCYMNSSGKWAKADASSDATARAFVMAADTILTDTEGKFLLWGFARNDTWDWTVGGEIYLSETVGELTQTAPITSNSITQVLGTAIHADRMYFKPSSVIIVHV
jgi:hypothetical protein